MTYSVVPAEPSDAQALAQICLDSFADDPIVGRIWLGVAPEASHTWYVQRMEKNFKNANRDGTRIMKVVDDANG